MELSGQCDSSKSQLRWLYHTPERDQGNIPDQLKFLQATRPWPEARMEDKKDTRDGKDSSSSSEYETESEAVAKAPKEDNTPNEEPDDAEDKEKSSSSSSEYETDGNASDSDAPKTRKRMQEGSVMGSTIGGGWDLNSYSLVPVNISFSNLFYR